MSVDHYENFPVASILLPGRLRPAVEAIYAFARSADDIADEGDASPEQRLRQLGAYVADLAVMQRQLAQPAATDQRLALAVNQRLLPVMQNWHLPVAPFADLINAFEQDVVKKRYNTYAEVLDYCRRSANPVGFLMLSLYNRTDAASVAQSDAICSALQLINFWQDVHVDWQKERIYIPQEDLQRFGVSADDIATGCVDARWTALMAFLCQRTETLMMSGAPLALSLPGRLGWELRLVVAGGLRILHKLAEVDYDVFRRRPTLSKTDWIRLLGDAIRLPATIAAAKPGYHAARSDQPKGTN